MIPITMKPERGDSADPPPKAKRPSLPPYVRKATAVRGLPPRLYAIVVENNAGTPFDYLHRVLVKFFHKSPAEGFDIAVIVNSLGRATAGVYPRDVAETKMYAVLADARSHGHALSLLLEMQ